MDSYNRTRYVEQLLEKTESLPPSFTVHLHPEFWLLNNGSKFLYNNQIASLLDDIQAYRIPVDFLEHFDSARVPFYDGCMVVELLDHRPQKSTDPALKIPEKSRVVLHPNSETLWADICSLNQRNGSQWADMDALEVEAKLLLSTSQPLCLDPDPHLTRIVNHVLRVSTPNMPASLKRKASALEPEEDGPEKAKRERLLAFMAPRDNRAHAPSYRLLDAIIAGKPTQPLTDGTQTSVTSTPASQHYMMPQPVPQTQATPAPPTPVPAPAQSNDEEKKAQKIRKSDVSQPHTNANIRPNGSHMLVQPHGTHHQYVGQHPQPVMMQPTVYANLQAAKDAAAVNSRVPTPAQQIQQYQMHPHMVQHYPVQVPSQTHSQSARPPSQPQNPAPQQQTQQSPPQHPNQSSQPPQFAQSPKSLPQHVANGVASVVSNASPPFQPTLANPQYVNTPAGVRVRPTGQPIQGGNQQHMTQAQQLYNQQLQQMSPSPQAQQQQQSTLAFQQQRFPTGTSTAQKSTPIVLNTAANNQQMQQSPRGSQAIPIQQSSIPAQVVASIARNTNSPSPSKLQSSPVPNQASLISQGIRNSPVAGKSQIPIQVPAGSSGSAPGQMVSQGQPQPGVVQQPQVAHFQQLGQSQQANLANPGGMQLPPQRFSQYPTQIRPQVHGSLQAVVQGGTSSSTMNVGTPAVVLASHRMGQVPLASAPSGRPITPTVPLASDGKSPSVLPIRRPTPMGQQALQAAAAQAQAQAQKGQTPQIQNAQLPTQGNSLGNQPRPSTPSQALHTPTQSASQLPSQQQPHIPGYAASTPMFAPPYSTYWKFPPQGQHQGQQGQQSQAMLQHFLHQQYAQQQAANAQGSQGLSQGNPVNGAQTIGISQAQNQLVNNPHLLAAYKQQMVAQAQAHAHSGSSQPVPANSQLHATLMKIQQQMAAKGTPVTIQQASHIFQQHQQQQHYAMQQHQIQQMQQAHQAQQLQNAQAQAAMNQHQGSQLQVPQAQMQMVAGKGRPVVAKKGIAKGPMGQK